MRLPSRRKLLNWALLVLSLAGPALVAYAGVKPDLAWLAIVTALATNLRGLVEKEVRGDGSNAD